MMWVMAEADGERPRAERVSGLDTSVAHPARVYDYWLGGKDNFAADREAAERVLAVAPGLRYRVRANRAFLGRASRYLAAEAGIRQFLDIGTGIPAADNTHEVAQRAAPDARVVYVDNDPIVLLHAQALLRSTPEGATDYLQADLRDPGTILDRAATLLDFGQPVAVMLLGVLHLVQDAEDPWGIVAGLMAAMPAGQLPDDLPSRHRHPPFPGECAAGLQRARRHAADAAHPGAGGQVLHRPRTWSSRGWCRCTSGGRARMTSPRKERCPRTAPWDASPAPSRPSWPGPGEPGGYLVSACEARSMIAPRSSRVPAR